METFETLYNNLKEHGIIGHQQQPKYFEECKKIWMTKIPQKGQCDCLQGELLREVEGMRFESVRNGNKNWDESFSWFCKHIYEQLSASGLFDEARLASLRAALDFLQFCGENTKSYKQFDVFDFVNDYVAEFSLANPEPIPYEKKNEVPK